MQPEPIRGRADRQIRAHEGARAMPVCLGFGCPVSNSMADALQNASEMRCPGKVEIKTGSTGEIPDQMRRVQIRIALGQLPARCILQGARGTKDPVIVKLRCAPCHGRRCQNEPLVRCCVFRQRSVVPR